MKREIKAVAWNMPEIFNVEDEIVKNGYRIIKHNDIGDYTLVNTETDQEIEIDDIQAVLDLLTTALNS